jgi:hypothetical protein
MRGGTWKSLAVLLLAGISLCGLAAAARVQKEAQRVTVGGVGLTVPQKYVKVPGEAGQDAVFLDAVFLYDKTHKEGMVVAVPNALLVDQDVVAGLMSASRKVFFPKETQPYEWKSPNQLQKVSRFEVGDFLGKGFNQAHLLVFECRHIVFNKKEMFVATIFEARKGKLAKEMFNGEGTVMSMSTCGASAEIIYSFTGEKIDPDKPPCELIANVP